MIKLIVDVDEPQLVSGIGYHLNTWILQKTEPIHPVAVRFLLYQIQVELEARLLELVPTNDKLGRTIKNYEKIYDLPETEELVESAEDRIRDSLSQSIIKRVFKNAFKEFTGEYEDNSVNHRNNLRRYTTGKLQQEVFEKVLEGVNILLDEMERYFENLKEIRLGISRELILKSQEHNNERLSDPSTVYVLASDKIKKKLWESISNKYISTELPTKISYKIYEGQYKRFCKKFEQQYVTGQHIEKVEKLFRQDVLTWCEQALRSEDKLNINVVQAIQQLAQFEAVNEDDIETYVKEKINGLNNLANPWVPSPIESDRSEFNAWGIHPDGTAVMSDKLKDDVFKGSELVISEAFSPHEIIRNKTLFGLTINDFDKFHCGNATKGVEPGNYYRAYTKRVENMQKGASITPHLDKRWHLPYYLPDINEENELTINENIDKSLVFGLMFGYIKSVEVDNKSTWEYYGEQDIKLIPVGQGYADKYIHSLHHALSLNPQVIDAVINRVNKQLEIDREKHGAEVSNFLFYKKAFKVPYLASNDDANLLDVVLRYHEGNRSDDQTAQRGQALFRKTMDLLNDLFIEIIGSHRSNLAKEEALTFIKQLLKDSAFYNQAEDDSRIKRVVDDAIERLEQAKA